MDALLENTWLIIIAVGIVFFFFRPISKRLLEREGFHFKAGGQEFKLEGSVVAGQPQISEEPAKPESPEVGSPVEAEPDDANAYPFAKWITPLLSGEIEKARSAFAETQRDVVSSVERKKNEAFFYFLAAGEGDQAAFSNLEAMTEDPEARSFAHSSLGALLRELGQHQRAREHYHAAAETAKTAQDRATHKRSEATCLAELGTPHLGRELLNDSLSNEDDSPARSTLYRGLAELATNETGKLACLAKALELNPDDRQLMFEAAYVAHQAGLLETAAALYHSLLAIQPRNTSAQGNLGVLYSALEKDMTSVDWYERAWLEGNTLAAANLASKLGAAGFETQALELLTEAGSREKPDPQVAIARSSIHGRRTREREEVNDIQERGRQCWRFWCQYAVGLCQPLPDQDALVGEWMAENGPPLRFQVRGSRSVVTLGGLLAEKYEGSVSSQAFHLHREKGEARHGDEAKYLWIQVVAHGLRVLRRAYEGHRVHEYRRKAEPAKDKV